MRTSPKIYVKGKQEIVVCDKFLYRVSIYKLWKQGFCIISEKYYQCDKPLNLKKIINCIKHKTHSIQRSITLEGAPENHLIKQGYKQKTV